MNANKLTDCIVHLFLVYVWFSEKGAFIRQEAFIREGAFIRSFMVHIWTRKDAS